jgi:acyl carrier protein phosphodiesterase
MNYLAHVFLARQSPDSMIGALLGDFVKSNLAGIYGKEIEREIHIHRRVDAFTDAHPVTKAARELFRDNTRRFAGISLDVFYDHALTQCWGEYCAVPLDEFIQYFYGALLERRHILPANLEMAVNRMVQQDWLGSYRDFDGVKIAVGRISTRLSKNGHLLRESLVDIEENYEKLSQGFDIFFPELLGFVEEERIRYADQ